MIANKPFVRRVALLIALHDLEVPDHVRLHLRQHRVARCTADSGAGTRRRRPFRAAAAAAARIAACCIGVRLLLLLLGAVEAAWTRGCSILSSACRSTRAFRVNGA